MFNTDSFNHGTVLHACETQYLFPKFEFHCLIEFLVMLGRNAKHAVNGNANLEYIGSSEKFEK